MSRRILLIGFFASMIIMCSGGLSGCSKTQKHNEVSTLMTENTALRSEVSQLRAQVAELQQTAKFHFQKGQSDLHAKKYANAAAEFSAILEDYPNDPLVVPAKRALADALEKFRTARAAEQREKRKVEAISGIPIPYARFYANWKAGDDGGEQRYRFYACLDQNLVLYTDKNSPRQFIASTEADFDQESEYKKFLARGRDYCGTIVVTPCVDLGMGVCGKDDFIINTFQDVVLINRLH